MIIGTQAKSDHEQNVKYGRETKDLTSLASQTKSVYCHKGMLESSINDFIKRVFRNIISFDIKYMGYHRISKQ